MHMASQFDISFDFFVRMIYLCYDYEDNSGYLVSVITQYVLMVPLCLY